MNREFLKNFSATLFKKMIHNESKRKEYNDETENQKYFQTVRFKKSSQHNLDNGNRVHFSKRYCDSVNSKGSIAL